MHITRNVPRIDKEALVDDTYVTHAKPLSVLEFVSREIEIVRLGSCVSDIVNLRGIRETRVAEGEQQPSARGAGSEGSEGWRRAGGRTTRGCSMKNRRCIERCIFHALLRDEMKISLSFSCSLTGRGGKAGRGRARERKSEFCACN